MRVSAVDDDVALLKVGLKLRDEVVDGVSSLDEQNNLAGSLELRAELLNRVGPDDRLAWGGEERVRGWVGKKQSATAPDPDDPTRS